MKILLLLAMAACLIPTKADAAVTAADLLGKWTVDVEKTWAKFEANPDIAQIGAEQLAQIKKKATATMASMVIEISADKMVATVDGQTKTQTYKITGIDGNVVSMEGTDEEGKTDRSKAEMKDGQLYISHDGDDAGSPVVLNRKAADAKPADAAKSGDAAKPADAGAPDKKP
jgi:hypothetical protein